jgi:tryptophanyl-tRNA synthetase
LYREKEGRYKELKEALLGDIKNFVRPLREKRAQLAQDKSYVEKILIEGGAKANAVAGSKLSIIKKAIGVL